MRRVILLTSNWGCKNEEEVIEPILWAAILPELAENGLAIYQWSRLGAARGQASGVPPLQSCGALVRARCRRRSNL